MHFQSTAIEVPVFRHELAKIIRSLQDLLETGEAGEAYRLYDVTGGSWLVFKLRTDEPPAG